MVNFPTPIGGNITDDDIVPCAVFLGLHALLLPAIAWNYLKRQQWNVAIIGSTIFAVERVVLYSLRLRQAYGVAPRTSDGLLFYQQATLGYGFIGVITDYLNMYRRLVVETTLPDTEAGHPNLVRRRFWFRRCTEIFALSTIPISVIGGVANNGYQKAIEDQSEADRLWRTRLGTIIVTFVIHQVAIASVAYGLFKLPRIRRRPCAYILSIFLLLEILFTYRIVILQNTETSLTDTGPGTLTSRGAKVTFYLLQSAIELCVMAFLLLSPMRRLYGVGKWGDPPDDRRLDKRLKKEEEERLASSGRLTPAFQEAAPSS